MRMENNEQYFNEYMRVLSAKYPTFQSAAAEIINLDAILRLPKGTEHFLSDVHGEYEAFCHIMNNCSGVIREKVEALYGKVMTKSERDEFATLIYYPAAIIAEMKAKGVAELKEWYAVQLHRLLEVCKTVASKYTRSKVRKSLPRNFDYIIDELINMDRTDFNKEAYYNEIFASIIELNRAEDFIVAITDVIKRLAVDALHIVGDLFDRGEIPIRSWIFSCNITMPICNGAITIYPGWARIWATRHVFSLSWIFPSNTAISTCWKNATAFPSENLRCMPKTVWTRTRAFIPWKPTGLDGDGDRATIAKMRKAVFFMLMKAEGQIIGRRPEYDMDDRQVLTHIDYRKGTVVLDGDEVRLNRCDFITVDPAAPLTYTAAEREVLDGLKRAFSHSEKLTRHVAFMFEKGASFKIFNDNLIFHGCIPLNADGSYMEFEGRRGKELMIYADNTVRAAYNAFLKGETDQKALDFAWYLWCGKRSPLFGREKLTTFERIYIDDEKYHKEKSNAYYRYCNDKAFCEKILRDFGIAGKYSHIVNGHVPVKKKDGESPVKAEGKLIVIDGGFCKAYHEKTGIAGYTLIYNSHGLNCARTNLSTPWKRRSKRAATFIPR